MSIHDIKVSDRFKGLCQGLTEAIAMMVDEEKVGIGKGLEPTHGEDEVVTRERLLEEAIANGLSAAWDRADENRRQEEDDE